MKCSNCGSEKMHVLSSRPCGEYIFRQRECKDCGRRFYTMEGEVDSETGFNGINEYSRKRNREGKNGQK